MGDQFDLDRAIFMGLFGAIAGVIAADKMPLYQKYITTNPFIAAPLAGASVAVADLGVRMVMAKGRQPSA